MGKNKDNRKRLASYLARVREHEHKIADEKCRANPDVKLIKYWEKEIEAHQVRIERLRRRLPQKVE
ncbi:MAG TPA: hypothetical protein VJZ26_18110 [Blastocatellia bacterium]|nr:hypothetical protein [Blastocatellia bacterium]